MRNSKEIERRIHKEGAEAVKGNCFFCCREVDGSFYCFGCKEFICAECITCDSDRDPSGRHGACEHRKEFQQERVL